MLITLRAENKAQDNPARRRGRPSLTWAIVSNNNAVLKPASELKGLPNPTRERAFSGDL